MAKTRETEHQFIFESSDENGRFEVRIHKLGFNRQIQMETGMDGELGGDETYINVSKDEIKQIIKMLEKSIKQ
jgi:hypothetical protein